MRIFQNCRMYSRFAQAGKMEKSYKAFVELTKHWWFLLLMLLGNFASFYTLFALEDQFEALAGVPTFDTQNELSAEQLLEQLPLYEGEALAAYYRFAAFDFVFPLVSAIFLVVLWMLFLRFNDWDFAQKLLDNGFPLLPLLVTAFDYGENLFLLLVLNGKPEMAAAAIFFKQLKLMGLAATGLISALLLLMLIANRLYRLYRKR